MYSIDKILYIIFYQSILLHNSFGQNTISIYIIYIDDNIRIIFQYVHNISDMVQITIIRTI
jgi:hypothetical protein